MIAPITPLWANYCDENGNFTRSLKVFALTQVQANFVALVVWDGKLIAAPAAASEPTFKFYGIAEYQAHRKATTKNVDATEQAPEPKRGRPKKVSETAPEEPPTSE